MSFESFFVVVEFLKTFWGLSEDFLRTIWGLSEDFLRTFEDLLRTRLILGVLENRCRSWGIFGDLEES